MPADPRALRDRCAIVGIGETRYSRNSGVSDLELQLEASLRAIRDAGLNPQDIDGIIAIAPGQPMRLAQNLGLEDLKLSLAMGLGGASPCAMVGQAVEAIAAGVASNVLCFYGANQRSGPRRPSLMGPLDEDSRDFEAPYGWLNATQHFAVMAARHMHLYGTTSRHLGVVAVTMRQHACLNPNAMLRQPITLEDHQRSRLVSYPFRLLDCCLETDGGAAVVVSSLERARGLPKPAVAIKGFAQGYGPGPTNLLSRPDILDFGLGYAAPRAFAMAGVTMADIDLAELFDCYTFVVIRQLEILGVCGPGEGGPYVAEGHIELGSDLPVNTHGGLLSQGHLDGMNHVVEAVRQLRGEAADAQVTRAELALVTGFGGTMAGLGSALILGK